MQTSIPTTINTWYKEKKAWWGRQAKGGGLSIPWTSTVLSPLQLLACSRNTMLLEPELSIAESEELTRPKATNHDAQIK
jgi:hypothetical protein